MIGDVLPEKTERMAREIVDAIFKVHSKFGPGLLESVYEACLEYEIRKRGFRVRRQVPVPLIYDDIVLDEGFRIDLLIEEEIIVEIKAVEQMNPIFEAQTLTYMRLSGHRLAFLVNFNVKLIKDGIKRIIN